MARNHRTSSIFKSRSLFVVCDGTREKQSRCIDGLFCPLLKDLAILAI